MPPGYNYLGPGNTLDRGDPTNLSDAAAQRHDYWYQAYQESGHNPYWHHNQADEQFIKDTTNAKDWGGKVGNLVFRFKRAFAPSLDAAAEASAKSRVPARFGGTLAGGKRRPPQHIWWNLAAKRKKSQAQKRTNQPEDPEEGPAPKQPAMNNDQPDGPQPMDAAPTSENAGGPATGGAGGGRGGGVGLSTGGFDNRTLWHFEGDHVTIICHASRLIHINEPTINEYQCFQTNPATPQGTQPYKDDYHAQCQTPWSQIDCNAWGVWMTPADFQQMITFCKDITLVSLQQGISNIVIKTVTETGPADQRLKVYNNDLTACLMLAEDTNNELPYTPQVIRQQTLGFIPWKPCTLPRYRYYLPSENRYPVQTATGSADIVRRNFHKEEISFFTIENKLPISLLRTGDDYETRQFIFHTNTMVTHYHLQSTRMLGPPPNAVPPDTDNGYGKIEPESEDQRVGWSYGQTGNRPREITTVRPFTVGYLHPEWAFVSERAGPTIHPALPGTRGYGGGHVPNQFPANNETKVQYDHSHGEKNPNTIQRFTNDNRNMINQSYRRDDKLTWTQNYLEPTDINNTNFQNGQWYNRAMNTYSEYAATDGPEAFYPWGQIWDKQPSTDIKPKMHVQAPFVCKDTAPGQLFVKLAPNLTDIFHQNDKTNNTINTFGDFYWSGTLTIKGRLKTPGQTNPLYLPTIPGTEMHNYVPDALGNFGIPEMHSRVQPKYMY